MHKKRIWKNTSRVNASSRKPTKKCAMKMKVERKKNDGRLNIFVGRKEFIRLVWKACVMDIKQLQLNDSWYIEGTYLFSKRVNRC